MYIFIFGEYICTPCRSGKQLLRKYSYYLTNGKLSIADMERLNLESYFLYNSNSHGVASHRTLFKR